MKNKKSKPSDSASPAASLVFRIEKISMSFMQVAKEIETASVTVSETKETQIDPFKLAHILNEREATILAAIPDAASDLSALRTWITDEKKRLVQDIEPRLKRLCTVAGYKCDGHFPDYVIEDFLSVKIIIAEEEIFVGGGVFRTLLVDAVFPAVITQVTAEKARKVTLSDFIAQLYRAYERTVLLQKARDGDALPLRCVYQEMIWANQADAFLKHGRKDRFTEYTIEHFTRDLSRLLQAEDNSAPNNTRVAFAPTSFPTEGVLVRQNGEARILGSVAFQ